MLRVVCVDWVWLKTHKNPQVTVSSRPEVEVVMANTLTLELIDQLIQLSKTHDEVGDEVQGLIDRVTDSGVRADPNDPFVVQTRALWKNDWAKAIGYRSLKEYRDSVFALAGEVPPHPPVDYLNQLVLVDRRILLTHACSLACVALSSADESFVPYDPRMAKNHGDVYWMWCQDGRRNRRKNPDIIRKELASATPDVGGGMEVGLDAFEFVAAYVQDSTIVGTSEHPHKIQLLGSLHAKQRSLIVCAGIWGEVEIACRGNDGGHAEYGAASRWAIPSVPSDL